MSLTFPQIPLPNFGRFLRPTRDAAFIALLALLSPQLRADEFAADLPNGVKAVWKVADAFHETTPTAKKLPQWPVALAAGRSEKRAGSPPSSWDFQVPGCWPGITDYMQKDSQRSTRIPGWKESNRPASVQPGMSAK